jgi:hypothetical protein
MTRLVALAALLALGCGSLEAGQSGAVTAPLAAPAPVVATPAPLQIFAHDAALEAPARSAAARILAATGPVVEVNAPGTSSTAVPMFWSEQHGKWIGLCGPGAAWLAIDSDLEARPADLRTVVLDETLHALGAKHLPNGVIGVMAPDVQGAGDGLLTEADLVSLCSAADCTAFAPELAP